MEKTEIADENSWPDGEDDLDDSLFVHSDLERYMTQSVKEEQKVKMDEAEDGKRAAEAAESFNNRRLQLNEAEIRTQCNLDTGNYQAQLQKLAAQYETEKGKSASLNAKYLASQGETTILRGQLDELRKSRQQEIIDSVRREGKEKKKHEEERREFIRERNALQTGLREKTDECIKLKLKVEMGNKQSPFNANKGVKSQGMPPNRLVTPPRAPLSLGAGSGVKFPSDPSLPVAAAPRQLQPVQVSPPEIKQLQADTHIPKKIIRTSEKAVETDEVLAKFEAQDAKVFCNQSINVSQLDSIASLHLEPARRKVFNSMQALIQLMFLDVQQILENSMKPARTEMLAKFCPGLEFKFKFPNLVDSMYLQGVQVRKEQESKAARTFVPVKYPVTPSIHNEGAIVIDRVIQELETHFIYGGAWKTLLEIKANLKKLLQHIDKENRFKLYEPKNITALWYLLAWAEYLWKFILYEEELELIVNKTGKELWVKELKEWSGLVLKIVWRDFFNSDIELMISRFSLGILESIVPLGYFEETQKRYEVLYSVMSDTLLKNSLRNENSIRQCLVIVTWLLADRNIQTYLCLGTKSKEKNCLALLLGEATLKTFKETEDPEVSTKLLYFYFRLLENLMLVQPSYLYLSKIAQPRATVKRQKISKKRLTCNDAINDVNTSSSEDSDDQEDDESSDPKTDDFETPKGEVMDIEQMSQYACPDKYKFDATCLERSKQFNCPKTVYSWINPEEWEMDLGFSGPKPCQCRRIFLGSAFVMLYQVTRFWSEAFLEHEKTIEESETRDRKLMALIKSRTKNENENLLVEEDNQILEKLKTKITSMSQFVERCQKEKWEKKKLLDELDGDRWIDWSWEELLNHYYSQVNSNDVEEPEWVQEFKRPENSFDCLIRQGAALMGYCAEKSTNLAMAMGSEGYTYFTFLESFFRFYLDENRHMTQVEAKIVSSLATSIDDEKKVERIDFFPKGGEEDDEDYQETIRSLNLNRALDLRDLQKQSLDLGEVTDKEFDELFRLEQIDRGVDLI